MKHVILLSIGLVPFVANAQNYQVSPVFGTNGAVHADLGPGGDDANAHALQPDGKLLLAGFGYDGNLNSYYVGLARFDTICGVPDPTFGNGGSITHTHQQRTVLHNMAMQPDGRIVGCGTIAPSNAGSQQKAGIFRFMPDGAVDSTFNGTGYHQPLWDPISSGALWKPFINADSTITCVGESRGNINGGVNAIGAMRFMYDGTLDPTFDGDGINTMPISASRGTGVMRPDGRVLAVGPSFINPNYQLVLAQFNVDGSPDTTFGVDGWTISPVVVSIGDESSMGASLLPDGRLIVSDVSADAPEGFFMARFLEDGTVDSTYATNGVSIALPPQNGLGRDHQLLDDGFTLQFGNHGGMGTVLMRDPEGAVVADFGTGGFADAATGFGGEGFRGGLMMPSSRIIGYGTYNGSQFHMSRLTTDPESEHFVDLGEDITVCDGEMVMLDATVPGGSYQWTDGSSMPTLMVTEAGSPGVTVTDANGCVDSDAVTVSFWPLPPQPVITGAGVEMSTDAVGDLQWSFDGNAIPGATDSTYSALENGDYTVTVTDTNGCSSTSEPFNVTSVGISEVMTDRLRAHPIPTSNRLMLDSSVPRGAPATAIDAGGRRTALAWMGYAVLDVSALAPGVYTLEIAGDRPVYLRFVKE